MNALEVPMLKRQYLLTAIAVALVGCNSVKPQPKAPTELTTFDQKVAYLQGYNLATNFQKYDLKLDSAVVSQAIEDVLNNRPLQLNEQERKAIKEDLAKRVKDAKEDEKQELTAANISAGEKFLAENKARPSVQVLPSGVQYKVIQEGKGAKPAPTDVVVLNYVGRLIDGTVFDNSAKGKIGPVSITMGKLVPGFKEALSLMPAGSKWEIYIPASLAYGNNAHGKVPPGSTLIFEVELVSSSKPTPAKAK
jgi:FKBP-type peptidyl-prolyl cis-trans isomerase